MVGVPSSCALLGVFAMGGRVLLLWSTTYGRTRNVSECLYSLYAWLYCIEQPAVNVPDIEKYKFLELSIGQTPNHAKFDRARSIDGREKRYNFFLHFSVFWRPRGTSNLGGEWWYIAKPSLSSCEISFHSENLSTFIASRFRWWRNRQTNSKTVA